MKKISFTCTEKFSGLSVDEISDRLEHQRAEEKKERNIHSKRKGCLPENPGYRLNASTVIAWNIPNMEKQGKVFSVTDV